ncbi:hypothetical protein NL676_030184 [Syzygium grande]|nr:hypothetical protein NL676_030184 [Syzygium grande]
MSESWQFLRDTISWARESKTRREYIAKQAKRHRFLALVREVVVIARRNECCCSAATIPHRSSPAHRHLPPTAQLMSSLAAATTVLSFRSLIPGLKISRIRCQRKVPRPPIRGRGPPPASNMRPRASACLGYGV